MTCEISYKFGINALSRTSEVAGLRKKELCEFRLMTSHQLKDDSWRDNRTTGSIILIDESTNLTVAAGLIV